MWRFVIRVWQWLRAEIVIGFLIASVFWAGVLGWQAANAPTDTAKQKCYDAVESVNHKSEECKNLWERTTSDPVALFTFWLVVSTIGLGVSTVLLWRAGEKQFRHARRSSAIQSRDMQDSIAVARKAAHAAQKSADALISAERAHLSISVEENNILEIVGFHGQLNDANREDDLETPGVGYFFKNFGKTHATVKEVGVQLVLAPKLELDFPTIPYIIREPFVGPQARTEKFGCLMFDTMTVGKALAFKNGESAFWLDGYIVFDDAFGVSRRYQYTLRYRTGENGFRLVRQSENIEDPEEDMDDQIPF